MSSDYDWLHRFRQEGAIWEYREGRPHASYEMDAKHAGFYMNTDIIVSQPRLVNDICEGFTAACVEKKVKPNWVISYAANICSGLILATKMAEKLDASFGYVDLNRSLCCFDPANGQSILIVTNDIHSGGSLGRTIKLIEQRGGKILPIVLTLANFHRHPQCHDLEIISLFAHDVAAWTPEECPLCKRGSPPLPARQNWRNLTS
jgi:hypothetical protein